MDERRIKTIEEQYEFNTKDKDLAWTKGMALSPRGCLYTKPQTRMGGRRSKPGFTCCEHCKDCCEMNQVTLYSIINYNFVGGAPDCLRCLTPVELAFLHCRFTNMGTVSPIQVAR